MQDAHDPYAALRSRDYRFLLSSNVLAAMCGEIQFAAVDWELWERKRDAAYLGYAGLAQFLPVLLLALPAGQAADHFPRKYLLMIAHATMAMASVGLALVSIDQGPVPLVFAFLVLAGMARALGMPSRGALIALVVPTEALGNAVTWSSTGWQVATVAGPALGGLIIASALGPAFAYCTTAAGLVFCIFLVTFLRPRQAPPAIQTRTLRDLLAGIRFVWKTELMLAAITLDLFAVLLGGATALLPIYAKDILQVDAVGFGWLRAAPSLGALITALVIAHRPPLERPGRTLLWSVTGFGLATCVFGVSENFYLSFGMLALTGAFDNVSVVVRGTLMQVLTPDEMRGRVTAVNAVFISSSNQLGAFESGITAKWFGEVASVVGGGLGTIAVVLTSMALWPRLRRLEPLHKLRSEKG